MYLIGLIGLIIGFILGILTMRLRNKNLYRQNILQKHTLKENTKKLTEYQKELTNYFNQNIKLLDIIVNNYQQLYQHIIKSSSTLLLENNNHTQHNYKNTENIKKNPFHLYNKDNQMTITTNQFPTEVPRDYPENNNQKDNFKN